jgi:hypothetical protein
MKLSRDLKSIRLNFNYHAKLLYILNERSSMIFNGRIFHEAIKGSKELLMNVCIWVLMIIYLKYDSRVCTRY